MRFTPKSEKQLNDERLWEAGEYDFEILEAEDTISKNSGADMIKLKVKIFKDNGTTQMLFDYLMESMLYKLIHLCDAVGLSADYESGDLESYKLKGKTGKAKIGISVDKTGAYPDKNQINDYIVNAEPVSAEEALGDDDEMPF